MKNLILGIIIGICITSLGVWGYSVIIPEDSAETAQNRRSKPADKNESKPGELAARISGLSGNESEGKNLGKAGQKGKDKKADTSGNSQQDRLKGDISSAVESFSDRMSEGRSSWQTLVEEIRGLKEKGEEGITELLSIIEGDGPGFFKMIAANVLGEIFSETQDPGLKKMLDTQVLSVIQNILDGESNMRLKRQAVNTLGQLGVQAAQDMLVDILLDDSNQWLQLTSMRVLREKGNAETAAQLVQMLQSSQDISHIMLAAGTLGKMNDYLKDPLINEVLQTSIPKLEKIVQDENQIFQNKRNALMTLGALGTSQSLESLIKVTENQAINNDGLQRTAVWALVRNGNQETAERLSNALSETNNEEAKVLFASALGGIANTYQNSATQNLSQSLALPTLKDLSQTAKNIDVQKMAIQAMGSVGTSQDIEFLQQIAQTNIALQPTADQAVRQIENRESGRGRWPMGRFMRPRY
jgi:HEAT repeat protein